MSFRAEDIRKDFPILTRTMHGKPLVYLDSTATSQRPESVIEAQAKVSREYNANVHRGIYELADICTTRYEEARSKVAKFLGASSPKSIVFTRNTTESINLVAFTWADQFLEPGDEIVTTEIEHHSNLVPWIRLAQKKRLTVKPWTVREDGLLDLDEFNRLLTPRTRLVCVTQMSNVLGTITPLHKIIEAAHRNRSLVLVDGAQGAPHLPTNVTTMGCDFFACSSHKMLGPTGIGILYGKEELLNAMDPFLGGGEMIREVRFEKVTYNELPWKFEAGTPNYVDGIAFGAAIDYLNALGIEHIRAHEEALTAYAMDKLGRMDGLTIYGPKRAADRGGVISFNLGDVHPHDVATALDLEGVAVRAGHHCAQPLMRRLNVMATARASFYVYNTEADVDRLVEALEKVRRFFTGEKTSAVPARSH